MCIGEQFLTYFCKYSEFWRVIIQSCNVEDRIDVFRIVTQCVLFVESDKRAFTESQNSLTLQINN